LSVTRQAENQAFSSSHLKERFASGRESLKLSSEEERDSSLERSLVWEMTKKLWISRKSR